MNSSSAAARVENPFPGLRPFQTDEAHLFYGRQQQVDELLERMAKHRFLGVVGTSGSGKSSLVRAGLLPALYRGYLNPAGSRWRIAVMRPGSMPLLAMAQALGEPDALGRSGEVWDAMAAVVTLSQSSLGLADLARQWHVGEPDNLLLVVDQFEEIFRFRRERRLIDGGEEAKGFVNVLLAAAEQSEVPVYVVLTMRSDFLGDCAAFPALPEALNRNQYLVPRMTRAQRRRSVEGPLEIAGVPVAQRLVQRILCDAGDEPENLPVMQHALMRTFEEWRESAAEAVDIEHYEKAGRMEGALDQHGEKVWSSLAPEQQECAARIFRCLTTSESGRAMRRPAQLEHICRIAGANTEREQALVKPVLDKFGARDWGFLAIDMAEGIGAGSVIDITHESLISHWKRLGEWAKEESESADWYKRLVRGAELHAKGQAGLWSDPDLQWVWTRRTADAWNADWAEQYSPGYTEAIAFLEKSKRAQELREIAEKDRRESDLRRARQRVEAERRAKRNYLVLAVALAGLLVAAVFLAIQAQTEKAEARTQQKRAEALGVQSEILTNRATAAERAAQAALKEIEAAGARGPEAEQLRAEASEARLQADDSSKKAVQLEHSQPSLSDQLSQTIAAQNRQIAALQAQLRDAQKANTLKASGRGATATALSTAAVSSPGAARRTSAPTPPAASPQAGEASVRTLSGHKGMIRALAWSPDGRQLASGGEDGVKLWDARSSAVPVSLREPGVPVDVLAYSPDSGNLVAATAREIYRWSLDAKDLSRRGGLWVLKKEGFREILDVAYNPDGHSFAVANTDSTVSFWDSEQGTPLHIMSLQAPATAVAYSPNGLLLATIDGDPSGQRVRLWKASTWKELRKLPSQSTIDALTFSADSKLLAGGGHDGKVPLWEVDSGKPVRMLAGDSNRVRRVAFAPGGHYLASCGDSSVQLWDIDTGKMLWTVAGAGTNSLAFSPDGHRLAASMGNAIKIWDLSALIEKR
jgi:WD40 repeat protein